MKPILLLLAFFGVGSTASYAASFDCNKAASVAEKLICATPALSSADERLYIDYKSARKVTGNSADFKKLAKQNWRTREQCSTVECLEAWYQQSAVTYQNIAANKKGACYSEGMNVSLEGTLLRVTYPGPPNYESVENGDAPEIYWVLQPDNPIACADDAPSWGDYEQMQLVVEARFYQIYQSLVGRRVSVTGSLMYSETGHHHTPLLIQTKKIAAAK